MVIDYSLKPPSLGVWLSLLNMLIDFWRKINLFTENTATTINSTSTENITTESSATKNDTATPLSNLSQDTTSVMDIISTDISSMISSKTKTITTFTGSRKSIETSSFTTPEGSIFEFVHLIREFRIVLTYSVLKRLI